MENEIVSEIILNKLNFLIEVYNFSIHKNEQHWLGGPLIEYKKDDKIISILYDKRESWFIIKLYSLNDKNKTHLYVLEELRNICLSLPSPNISSDNKISMITFLETLGECLENHLFTLLENFEKGDYYGGEI